ncbi:glycoside hydrolase family 16 protein [Gracilimonas mengyeensis]|uniref:Beta-glucanase, GH16 family n=1 Tax=Gracilimonas mengyeensis TaxID=1302730 RepID=A0A521EXH1_9BACT|nr:glycoside hydrolase family 16 protein [Gracilimonas mengyeensis]SMO88644.1 Beta-glucanase, GH16 family [Gracilimonas mengyeensis]
MKLIYILLIGVPLLAACTATTDTTENYELVWSDEFNSTELDTSKWDFNTGTGAEIGLIGWGNNELQYYREGNNNVSVTDGNLVIEARKENYSDMEYTSAKLVTQNKAAWKYGKVEVRAKVPETQGIWPAIWMMPTESAYGNWPRSGEIDLMELLGHQPDTVYGTAHFGNSFEDRGHFTKAITLEGGENFSNAFHTYAVEWKPDTLKWFLDGDQYHTMSSSDIKPYNWPFDKPFYLILNVAVGGNWPGNPDETTRLPQQMKVDYVRVYQKAGN